MERSRILAFLVAGFGFISVAQADDRQTCRPELTIQNVQFSDMQPPTMQRKWTAAVSVDGTGCVANSAGYFEIVFIRLKETGLDLEFRERFAWVSPSVKVAVDFWADESVGQYWIDNVTPCACSG
jgi:hypothetical protein